MTEINESVSKLMEEYSKEFLGKVFYFALKKTGSEAEAENLCSEITLNIFLQLKKGNIPMNFTSWVWKIARNRYAKWAEEKHKRASYLESEDIGDMDVVSKEPTPEESFLKNEELSLLRRELSFISSDYRNIVLAYYVENRSVSDIANSLKLPKGTVESKLFRARKILKEGMSMAREFGKLSYSPEKIGFSMNGKFGSYGEPWNYLNRLLCVNIMLAAYRNPSTAEELAIEVGVALPYMENELEALVNSTLMRKKGNKYETAIYITSAEAQDKVGAHLIGMAPELYKAVRDILEFELECCKEKLSAIYGGTDFECAKWSLILLLTDKLARKVENKFCEHRATVRPNGGEWDLSGHERYEGDRFEYIGLHGCQDMPKGEGYIDFGMYKLYTRELYKKMPDYIPYTEVKALKALAINEAEGINDEVISGLCERGFVNKTEKGYDVKFLVINENNKKPMNEAEKAEYKKLWDKAIGLFERQYVFGREICLKEVPEVLKNDKRAIDIAVETASNFRGAVITEAEKDGYLKYDPENIMTGVYMVL
ncbi:MAG: sigma-70 family RNA polymerase sigma factor [Ruminococcaceae bacterium]|nr:sigma-70 family RNA polymerase sigma factor [Oscillospiraceae bacterium]